MGMIIAGDDCKDCKYATVDDTDVARVIVYCDARDKKYYYGQCIPCEDKVKVDLQDNE